MLVKGAHFGNRFFGVAFFGQQQGGGLGVFPLCTQRLDHRRQHQALDVGARCVVRAQRVALFGVERAFKQRAEDGGFDFAPIGFGRFEQQINLVACEFNRLRRLEQLAVEAQHVVRERGAKAAAIHVAPESVGHAHERLGVVAVLLQQLLERACGQQADVFGEHGEQTAGEKARDLLRVMAGGFERFGDFGQLPRHFARDAG